MPHGNFDKPPESMRRSTNGDFVEACGPLFWDGDDRPAQAITVEHVEITQGDARAEKDVSTQATRGEPEWMVQDVRCSGPGRFQDGPATAKAKVKVLLQSGDETREHWRETVLLSH